MSSKNDSMEKSKKENVYLGKKRENTKNDSYYSNNDNEDFLHIEKKKKKKFSKKNFERNKKNDNLIEKNSSQQCNINNNANDFNNKKSLKQIKTEEKLRNDYFNKITDTEKEISNQKSNNNQSDIKSEETSNVNNTNYQNKSSKDKMIKNESEEINSIDEEFESGPSERSEEEVRSLMQIQLENNKMKNENIIIKHIKTEEIICLNKIKDLFAKKDYSSLENYKFPYMSQSTFNFKIYNIDLKNFRGLLIACPICNHEFRHYSIPDHIFQYHFKSVDEFLTKREIAHGCERLMRKMYKKINDSLNIFSDLSTLFNNCQFRGNSLWRNNAVDLINDLKNMKMKDKYFNNNIKEARKGLEEKLPLNSNKNKRRMYKELEKLKVGKKNYMLREIKEL